MPTSFMSCRNSLSRLSAVRQCSGICAPYLFPNVEHGLKVLTFPELIYANILAITSCAFKRVESLWSAAECPCLFWPLRLLTLPVRQIVNNTEDLA